MIYSIPVEPSLQSLYRTTQMDRLRPRLRLALIAALVLIPIFIPWVRYVDPDNAERVLPIQLGLFACLLLFLLLTYREPGTSHLSLTALAAGAVAYTGVSLVLSFLDDGFLYGSALLLLAMLVSTTLLSDIGPRLRLLFAAHALVIPNAMLALTHAPTVTIINTNWILVPGIVISLVLAFQVDQTNQRAFLLERALEEEKRKSDSLLASILPPVIAERLKRTETRIADVVNEATIVFADLVGFTPLVQQLSPDELVEILDQLFARLDELATRHGVEKIKTIGDAYMAATGVADASEQGASEAADFALEAVRLVERFAAECQLPLKLRVGISTGPVVSGVIGRRKPQFDLWGETVNRASRLQSSGLAGEIQVDEPTARSLDTGYLLEPRGALELRGIGQLQTWLLKRSSRSSPSLS